MKEHSMRPTNLWEVRKFIEGRTKVRPCQCLRVVGQLQSHYSLPLQKQEWSGQVGLHSKALQDQSVHCFELANKSPNSLLRKAFNAILTSIPSDSTARQESNTHLCSV